jgi:hypothetical protein
MINEAEEIILVVRITLVDYIVMRRELQWLPLRYRLARRRY